MDAGTSDGGRLDAGGDDAGLRDAGLNDAGLNDAGLSDAGHDDAGADAGLDAATGDAGRLDAGRLDAGRLDAGRLDAGRPDAGPPTDAGTCDESAVRYAVLASGPLRVGTLCDDLFVCVADAAEAARVTAASSAFSCSGSGGFCPGMSCAYQNPGGPSLIDMGELDEICAVTLIRPRPDLVCVVYP